MFKSQVGKFSSVFGTSKDKRNQETTLSLAYRELGSKKACKIGKYRTRVYGYSGLEGYFVRILHEF